MLVTLYSKHKSMLDTSKYVDGIIQGFHYLNDGRNDMQGIENENL